MGEDSCCCQCAERRQRRVAPSPGKNEGFEMVQIRPKRTLRIQHLKAKISDRQDTGVANHTDEHVPNHSGETCKSGMKTGPDELPQNVISANGTSSSADGTHVRSNSRESGVRGDDSVRQTPMSIRDIDLAPEEITKRIQNIIPEDVYPSDENRAVIFFFHGVGGSSDVWTKQLRYFCDRGYEIVAPDMLGHGFSSTPSNPSAYTFFQLYQDLLAVFDKYSKKKNVLVGHSYGASFTAKLATERRNRVSKLIMISGGGPLPLKPATCDVFCLPTCLLACCRSRLQDSFFRQAFHGLHVTPEDREYSFDIPSYVLKGVMNGQVWEEGDEDYHRCITPDTLIMYGNRDKLVTKDEEEWMNEAIHGSELKVIEDASHMVMMENPELVSRHIQEFITKRPRASRSQRPTTSLSRLVSYRRESKIVW